MEKWTEWRRGSQTFSEEELPREVWSNIFDYLSGGDLSRARCVCSSWNEMIVSDPSTQLKIRTVLAKAKKKKQKKKTKRKKMSLALSFACCPGPILCCPSLFNLKSEGDNPITNCLQGTVLCILCPIVCPILAVRFCSKARVDKDEEDV